MADLTLADAQDHLDKWLAADLAVSRGQQYSMGTFSLSRADSEQIRQQIAYWRRQVKNLTARAAAGTDDYARRMPGVSIVRVS